ncbi:PH domain-containing protein [Flavobacterium sp. '19STA2R22 D10 B1']|uniref:PH domain-containing protein n=1 Tax=Flavobacterium aerium TaxID=3037261 RepID=UPI00278C7244|nr:PH domain-containing protein [Flavobacterium sp. '19STA2R22 D10 B1']
MENFSNETIDITALPKYEEVQFLSLHPNYLKVIYINITVFLLLLAGAIGVLLHFIEELKAFTTYIGIGYLVFAICLYIYGRLSFKLRGYALREHDILFKSGVIATKTIIVPFNRIQHVAIHEGLISRMFKLTILEIFTAGGNSSDMHIRGLEKDKAEPIKQLLMGQIQNQI